MEIKEEIKELFNLITLHTDDIEQLNFFIRMKNGTIFKYKIDKKKEFKIKLREKMREFKENTKNK